MKTLLAAFAVMATLACAPVAPPAPETPSPPSPGPASQGEDTCGMARYQHLLGKRETEIDRAELPPRTRIICPQCMVTQDYIPERLNLFTSTEGRIASMRCF